MCLCKRAGVCECARELVCVCVQRVGESWQRLLSIENENYVGEIKV